MLHIVTVLEAAHGKGKEALDFVKGTSDHFNSDAFPLILESTPLMSRIGSNSTLLVVNRVESYAAWEKITQSGRDEGSGAGLVGGIGKDFIVPGSVVRHIYEVIE